MAWLKLDDSWDDDPKVKQLTPMGQLLWVKLLSRCKKGDNGNIVAIAPKVPWTAESFAKDCRVRVDEVRRFFQQGQELDLFQIDLEGFISINNWDKWQGGADKGQIRVKEGSKEGQDRVKIGSKEGQKRDHSPEKSSDFPGHQIREDKIREEKNIPPQPPKGEENVPTVSQPKKTRKTGEYSPEFEAFWLAYPRKVDKGTAWDKWKARIKKYNPEQLIKGATNYALYCKQCNTEERFIKHPSTFLSDKLPFLEWQVSKNVPPSKAAASPDEITARKCAARNPGCISGQEKTCQFCPNKETVRREREKRKAQEAAMKPASDEKMVRFNPAMLRGVLKNV